VDNSTDPPAELSAEEISTEADDRIRAEMPRVTIDLAPRQNSRLGQNGGTHTAANILAQPREAHYEAVPDVVYTDPQAAAAGATEAVFSAALVSKAVCKGCPHDSPSRLTGAYALGPRPEKSALGPDGSPRRSAGVRGRWRLSPRWRSTWP
jgi:hypothetical protein